MKIVEDRGQRAAWRIIIKERESKGRNEIEFESDEQQLQFQMLM